MTVRSLISVHRPRYFRFCNVLATYNIWTIRADPTYRVYRLYDYDIKLYFKDMHVHVHAHTCAHTHRLARGKARSLYRALLAFPFPHYFCELYFILFCHCFPTFIIRAPQTACQNFYFINTNVILVYSTFSLECGHIVLVIPIVTGISSSR